MRSLHKSNSPQRKSQRESAAVPTSISSNVYKGVIDFDGEIVERERSGDKSGESSSAPPRPLPKPREIRPISAPIRKAEKRRIIRRSLVSFQVGGSQEIRNIVIVCSVMYLLSESGLENRSITEIVLSLGNSSYPQNSPFLSTFSTSANPRRFVSIMTEQAISPTP